MARQMLGEIIQEARSARYKLREFRTSARHLGHAPERCREQPPPAF